MNIQIAVLCLVFATSCALAQKPEKAAQATAAERAATIETLQKGEELTANRERYQLLPQVVAVELGSTETPEQAIARLGGDQFIETKGRLVLFRSAQQKPAFVEQVEGSTVYPTVLNMRTGTFGVLLGTLIVKPKSMTDAAAIASSYGLETVKEYPQLQTVFYRAGPNLDIADVTARMQSDIRIENAYPEIVEHVSLPK